MLTDSSLINICLMDLLGLAAILLSDLVGLLVRFSGADCEDGSSGSVLLLLMVLLVAVGDENCSVGDGSTCLESLICFLFVVTGAVGCSSLGKMVRGAGTGGGGEDGDAIVDEVKGVVVVVVVLVFVLDVVCLFDCGVVCLGLAGGSCLLLAGLVAELFPFTFVDLFPCC